MQKLTEVGEGRAAYRAPGVHVILSADTRTSPSNITDDPPSAPPASADHS